MSSRHGIRHGMRQHVESEEREPTTGKAEPCASRKTDQSVGQVGCNGHGGRSVGEVGEVGGVGDNVLSNREEASGQERGTARTPSRGSPQRYCLTYARESVILGSGRGPSPSRLAQG